MSTLVPYSTFQCSRRVSIWIGNFRSSADLDEYLCLSERFEQDFGFHLSDRNMPEIKVESGPRPIESLVEGFSWSEEFREAAAAAAHRMDIQSATTAIVFHHFAYDPTRATVAPDAPLTFVGSFSFGA